MNALYEYQQLILSQINTSFLRYKYYELDWNRRVFGIVGPRGVGKTTMVLQYIKQNLSLQDSLYITLDHIYFSTHTLIDVADKFYKEGGKHLIIDEVHKALNWSVQLKQIIDSYHLRLKQWRRSISLHGFHQVFTEKYHRTPVREDKTPVSDVIFNVVMFSNLF
jgi:predicted AAA+ superfamily ATPase